MDIDNHLILFDTLKRSMFNFCRQWNYCLGKFQNDEKLGEYSRLYNPVLQIINYDMSGQQLHIYGEILPHDGRKFPQFSRVAEMEKIYLIPKKISSF